MSPSRHDLDFDTNVLAIDLRIFIVTVQSVEQDRKPGGIGYLRRADNIQASIKLQKSASQTVEVQIILKGFKSGWLADRRVNQALRFITAQLTLAELILNIFKASSRESSNCKLCKVSEIGNTLPPATCR